MKNKFLHEIADWFTAVKAPDLKDKVSEAVANIDNSIELTDKQRKLLGFICFSFSMNHGPSSFIGVEMCVKDIGVGNEFHEYAKDWIDHSNQTSTLKSIL